MVIITRSSKRAGVVVDAAAQPKNGAAKQETVQDIFSDSDTSSSSSSSSSDQESTSSFSGSDDEDEGSSSSSSIHTTDSSPGQDGEKKQEGQAASPVKKSQRSNNTRKHINKIMSSFLHSKGLQPPLPSAFTNAREQKNLGEGDDDSESSSSSSGTTDDDEEDSGDEYFMSLPASIKQDPRLSTTYEKIKTYIKEKRTPDLTKILGSRIAFKRKVELVESMVILDNCEPFTEEYLQIRGIIMKLLPMFKKEYKEKKVYKDSLKILEKKSSELDNLHDLPIRILNLNTNEENKKIIYRKYMEFRQMSRDDEEFGKMERWLKMSLQLPYDNVVQGAIPNGVDTSYLNMVRKKLDTVLYGMNDVKEQIVLFLHVRLLNPSIRGCSLGLIGPPGCGKTTIARSLADVIEYPFQQISFGGVNSSDYLKGHNYTYVGSRPGEIVRCLMRMKNKNGILFFDEYDKVSQNADIVSTLLHITDFSQNSSFRDNYFSDIEVDLSSLWFIYSMNELPENSALRDRIFPITIKGYSEREKVRIVIDYLFPRYLKDHLLHPTDVVVSDAVAAFMISMVCKSSDKGIRNLEKAVKDIIRKISFLYHHRDKCDTVPSFRLPTKISFPFVLTTDVVSVCLKKSHCYGGGEHEQYMNMYS